ncbi:MAG: hypothetical protein ACJAZB_001696 [Psychrosphaera sp.]|jgi:hypothetical protein
MITYTPNQSFFSEIKNLRLDCLDTKPDISLGVSHDKCSNNIVVALTFKFKSCFISSVQLVTPHQRDFNVELGSSVNFFYLDSSSIFYLR